MSRGRRGGAVLGSPIAHSLSPVLHLAAYVSLGLDGWRYRAIECDEKALSDVLRALDAEGLAGASLTMPLKRAVLPMLARVDDVTDTVGAANTVLFGDVAGDWQGANTDVPGMVAALRRAGVPEASAPCVLGAGATAASALAALAGLGAEAVDVVARRPEAVDELTVVATRLGLRLSAHPWERALPALADADVVVSTTPAGATDAIAGGLGERMSGVLFDVVYVPWPTALAAAWSGHGGRVVGGLELLVQQAAVQVELMTGRPAPVDAMREAGEAALSPGRPGAG